MRKGTFFVVSPCTFTRRQYAVVRLISRKSQNKMMESFFRLPFFFFCRGEGVGGGNNSVFENVNGTNTNNVYCLGMLHFLLFS